MEEKMNTIGLKKLAAAGILTVAALATAQDSATRLESFGGEPLVPRLNTTLLINGGEAENEALKTFLLTPASNPSELAGKRVAVISTDGVEELELSGPIQYLKERGAHVDLVSPHRPVLPAKYGVQYPEQRKTHILTVRFMEDATWFKIDRFLDEAKAKDYDAVIIPGGAWNPDSLRQEPEAIRFVREMNDAGKTVAAICHGPLVLVNAGLLPGKHATSYWNVQIDVRNAGAIVEDKAVVVDGNLITSRFPFDLPQFMGAIRTALVSK